MGRLKWIYFSIIILLTCALFGVFFYKNAEHQKELDKIKNLEVKQEDKQRKINEIRKNGNPCPIPNLNDPRSCYIDSNYRCSWNESAERCDLKI